MYNPIVLRTLITSLSMAVVAAIVEVLVRYSYAGERIIAPQLTLAAITNVAGLGLIAVGLVCMFWACVWVYAQSVKKFRPSMVTAWTHWFFGLVLVVLLLQTEVLGLCSSGYTTTSLALFTAGMTVFAGSKRKHNSKSQPYMSKSTQICVVAAWLLCTSLAVGSVMVTRNGLEEWVDASMESATFSNKSNANIVLVVLDTLRADRVGVYHGGDLTPNIDKLAETSIVYTNAHSTAPWTLPTHASLFTGLYPDKHGVNWGHYRMEPRDETLPQLLKEQGYDTFAISNNWLLSKENGFAQGFDSFIETTYEPLLHRWRMAMKCGVVKSWAKRFGLSTDVSHDAGSSWTNWMLRKQFTKRCDSQKPFFAFINYFEAHDPYEPPSRFLEKYLTEHQRKQYKRMVQSEQKLAAHACGLPGVFNKQQIKLLSALYDAEVAYQDEVIGELVQMLEETGLLDQSWLIITSDHGELFGEQGMVYHTAGSHDKLLHIPLLIRPPGGASGWKCDAPVQPVDLFVTLLQQAGVSLPADVKRAYPVPLSPDDPVYRKISIAQTHGASIAGLSITQRMNLQVDLSKWMTWVTSIYSDPYLLEADSKGPRALFDLKNDPGMSDNLIHSKPDIVKSIKHQYELWSKQG